MGVFDNYDDLSKGIVHATYNIAEKRKNNPVDVPHLFFVLINQSSNVITELLNQGGANLENIRIKTQESLAGLLSIQQELSISEELDAILRDANAVAKTMGDTTVSIYHIFLSLLKSKNAISKLLNKQGITFEKMQSIVAQMPKAALAGQEKDFPIDTPDDQKDMIDKYSDDLTQIAKDGKLKEVIGREKELAKMIEILCRKEKNNVVILGESGVGKTALAEFLAQKIVAGEVPAALKDKKILRVDLSSIIGGTKFRGEFESKVSSIIKSVKAANGKVILFIDDFHNVAGAGKAEGSMGLSEMIKPELSNGNIQIIGATTTSEYRQNIEKDTGLTRRFETLTVEEPSVQDTITILRGIEESYEKFHGVTIHDTALVAAVELSNRYINDRKLPDKAITVIDQAATKVENAMTSLPSNISDIKIKIGQLTREKNSITQELSVNHDKIIQKEGEKRIEEITIQLTTLQASYDTSKATREAIRTAFEENKTLELACSEWENQAKTFEAAANLEKVSEIRYGKILDIQKKIAENKQKISDLQIQSGITIKDTVEREDIAKVISEKTGIPLTKMIEEEGQKLANLESYLATKVIGQPEAISAISNAIRRARIGLKDPKKPIGSFIFLGPTGVGKTELAKALAEFLFFDKKAMVRLNMSEYQSESSPSKLIGSDPGLIGSEQGGQLTEALRRKPYCVVLLDEVEKAHPKVFDMLLQVFDDGIINDNHGNLIDCKNAIFIMTSNIGSHEIMEKLQGSSATLGDIYPSENSAGDNQETGEQPAAKHKRNRRPKKEKTASSGDHQNSKTEDLKEELKPIMMDFFRPEFLNRLDDTIIFNPISSNMFKDILEIKLHQQLELIYATSKISIIIHNQAKNFLAKKGRDPANGARPIDRALQNYLTNPLAKEIVSGKFHEGDTINVAIENDTLVFTKHYQ